MNYAGCTSIHYYNSHSFSFFRRVSVCVVFFHCFYFHSILCPSLSLSVFLSVWNYILRFYAYLRRAQLLYNYRNIHKSFHSIFPLKRNRMFSTLSSDLNRLQWSKCTAKQSMRLNKTGWFIFTSAIQLSWLIRMILLFVWLRLMWTRRVECFHLRIDWHRDAILSILSSICQIEGH